MVDRDWRELLAEMQALERRKLSPLYRMTQPIRDIAEQLAEIARQMRILRRQQYQHAVFGDHTPNYHGNASMPGAMADD